MSVSINQLHDNKSISFRASSCGLPALKYLQDIRQGKVFGVTSRGVFLQISPQRVIFLSKEPYRGPLTINFPGYETQDLQVGEIAEIKAHDWISFPRKALFVLRDAEIWEAKPEGSIDTPEKLIQRLKKCARLAVVEKQAAGLSSLLGPILGIDLPFEVSGDANYYLPILASVKSEIQNERFGNLPIILSPVLGRGIGLTPSGDDLILGLVLALNRYPSLFCKRDQIAAINQIFPQQAYARTTTLSANLIECATQGQVDERLITGLNGLTSGNISPEACAELFGAWGNSSGVDALAGFSLAVISLLNY